MLESTPSARSHVLGPDVSESQPGIRHVGPWVDAQLESPVYLKAHGTYSNPMGPST